MSKIVLQQNITSAILNEDTFLNYKDMVDKFQSRVSRFTTVLKNNYREISNHTKSSEKEYNNTVLLLLDRKENCIIAYCSFDCSCVKSSKGKVYPAIEILTFALNKDYCGETYVSNGKDKNKCSDFAIEFYINYFKMIQKKHIYAYIVRLQSENNDNVMQFYRRNNFFQAPLEYTGYNQDGGGRELNFFRLLGD